MAGLVGFARGGRRAAIGALLLSVAILLASCGGTVAPGDATALPAAATDTPPPANTPTSTPSASPALESTPSPAETPTVEGSPAASPSEGAIDDQPLLAGLPDGVSILQKAVADLNQDGEDEVAVVYGRPVEAALGAEDLQIAVFDSGSTKVWESPVLAGERAEELVIRDMNGDGWPEVLSGQSMGAAGSTLYVLRWNDSEYAFAAPRGGEFDGRLSFGDKGYGFEDLNGDGLDEILGAYGPAASKLDVYEWIDGAGAYVYVNTLRLDDTGELASAEVVGRVVEVSASAKIIRIEPEEGDMDTIALLEGTQIEWLDGTAATLADIRPGLYVRAVGREGEGNTLLPAVVMILDK